MRKFINKNPHYNTVLRKWSSFGLVSWILGRNPLYAPSYISLVTLPQAVHWTKSENKFKSNIQPPIFWCISLLYLSFLFNFVNCCSLPRSNQYQGCIFSRKIISPFLKIFFCPQWWYMLVRSKWEIKFLGGNHKLLGKKYQKKLKSCL